MDRSRPATRRRFLRTAAAGVAASPAIGPILGALPLAGGLVAPGAARAATGGATGAPAGAASPPGADLPVRAIGRPFPAGLSLDDAIPGFEEPDAEGRALGIAVVGLGDFALRHMLPAISLARHARIAGLVSGNPDKAARVAAAYGVPDDAVRSYDDFDSIAGDDRVDAVYIVLPNALHAEWTERAFAAGKHVLCEKPMATSASDCERMIRARDEAGLTLMIAYRAHFEPYNLNAVARIDDGRIGSLTTLVSDHHRILKPEEPRDAWRANLALAGGGALPDIGIYGLNAFCYLTGESPVEVFATQSAPADDPRFAEIENQTLAQLRFGSGVMANLSCSYTANVKSIHAYGDAGSIEMQPATAYEGNTLVLRTAEGVDDVDCGDSIAQFTGEIDGFASAVLDGAEVRTPGEMGLRDVRIIEAIQASARERRPLRLAADGSVETG